MPQETLVLPIQRRDDDDDSLTPIGQLSFGERGQLAVVEAVEGFAEPLADIVQTVNAKEELRIKVPPPPEAPDGSLYRKEVKRDDPDLLHAMQEFLEQKYNLVLGSPASRAAAVTSAAEPQPGPVGRNSVEP